ncbi:MAG TPA: hypothetical protein VN176_08790 [Verrucomicrobiae bacterium]|nr:hypothetical protein [Verrucomicrobiae bacterium]
MRIDQTHRPWILRTGALFLLALLAYVPYSLFSYNGPSGGSSLGLIYGVAGYLLMIFAALLSVRKKFRIWRIGRAQTWMRGHLWLGLLSYPLIFFHAGFSWGHGLARLLMWIVSIVIVSGLLGAALQHYMPRMITERVPMETIYNQIHRVQEQLLGEADDLMGSLSPEQNEYGLIVPSSGPAATMTTTSTAVQLSQHSADKLRQMYDDTIKPYLAHRGSRGQSMADEATSKAMFAQLRTVAPDSIGTVIDDLENICQEKRDLDRQSRLQRMLQGWLLVHIPLSYLLLTLVAIHAIMALRY